MIYWFALVCTFSDTEAATEVTVDGLRQILQFRRKETNPARCLPGQPLTRSGI